jgi:hypothetical protein
MLKILLVHLEVGN